MTESNVVAPTAPPSQLGGPKIELPKPHGATEEKQWEAKRRTEDPKKTGGPFVQYVGVASKRTIAPHAWAKRVGDKVKEPGVTHTWSIKNNKLVPTSEFSPEQLDYLLVDDLQAKGGHSFLEVDYDDDEKLVQVHLLNKDSDDQ